MTAGDGYLSKDREHLARLQRERRQRMTRIDYMPSCYALGVIDAKRAAVRPGSVAATNSAVLDAIVTEWAELTGINWNEKSNPMTSARRPELSDAVRARMSSEEVPDWLVRAMGRTENRTKQAVRITCGAARHRDGLPCQALSEPGKKRCRFHGGRSTGPRTPAGKARALANLRRGARPPSPAKDGGSITSGAG